MIFEKLAAESWNIAFRNLKEASIFTNKKDVFQMIKNPVRYWAADPFVFEWRDKTYLFAELFDYCTNKGVIGCTELTSKGITNWKVIINEKWHLSYPFVFEYNGEVYLLPEMNDRKSQWLYKAEDFPYHWRKEKVILDNVRFVDTTLFYIDNSFIAYAQDTRKIPVAFRLNNELDFEEYISCKGNNEYFIRPGGRIFTHDNDCYVVCQDCSKTYGGALVFYKVGISDKQIIFKDISMHLTPEDINLNCRMKKEGVHTYTATSRFEVVDIKTSRMSILNLLGRVLLRLRRKV